MKRSVIIFLVLALALLTAVGCNTDTAGDDVEKQIVDDGEKQTVDDDEKQIVIAYSQAELVNAWRVTNQKDMEAQIEAVGAKVITADANQDPSKQLTDIQNMLAQNPDVLIVSPLESQAIAPVVEMVNDAGVPLIIIDRNITAEPGVGMYITEITQSHVEAGRMLALEAVEMLTEKNGAPTGNVVRIQGMAGASPCIDATTGWNEVMADYPDIVEVAIADAMFTKEGGMNVMEDFLQRFPAGEIDLVRSDYSDMTMGALEAIKNAGRDELFGYVIGQGGHYLALEAVAAGEIGYEVQTPPYFGELAVKSALDILAGKSIPSHQFVEIKGFSKNEPDVVNEYLQQIKGAELEF